MTFTGLITALVMAPSSAHSAAACTAEPAARAERIRGDSVSHQIYTDRQVMGILLDEGHVEGDVTEELNALVRSGLVLSQPPDAWLVTDEELDLLRLRLQEQGE